MEVDYLLYHEDSAKVDKMMDALSRRNDFLFNTTARAEFGLSTHSRTFMQHEHTWQNVAVRGFGRVGRNVVEYRVTLPSVYVYPEFVAAALIEKNWEVKARYRESGKAWTYEHSDFPAGTTYTRPADWQG